MSTLTKFYRRDGSRQSFSCLLVLVAALICVQVSATDADVPLDEVSVTASRLGLVAAEQSRSVELISREDIERRQAPNVTELLRQVAGLNVIQQGSRGNVTSVLMRGGEPNFTVVLIDGLQVNDPTNTRGGSYDFSYLDPSAIERIEIVRGPMSAQYGSDSLAGVINIITRTGETGSEVRAELGGNGFRAAGLSLGVVSGRVSGAIRLHSLTDDGDLEGGSYDDVGLDAKLVAELDDANTLAGSIRYIDANSTGFPEDSGGPLFAAVRQADVRDVVETHAQATWNHRFRSNLSSMLALGRFEREEDFASPGIAPGIFDGVPPNAADTRFTRDRIELSVSSALTEAFTVNVGGEWQREQGVSFGQLDFGFVLPTDFRLERDTLSAFVEGVWQFSRAQFQGSLRWDDPDEIDSETSAQFGMVVELGARGNSQLRANWGQGFKAPSFFALAHPLVGNPDLLSETADSLELGVRHRFGDQASPRWVEATVFESTFENLIDFDPQLFTNVNRREVVNRGVELSGSLAVNNYVSVRAHATYLDSEIKDSDTRLRGRPNWRFGAVVDWTLNEQWQVVTSLLAVDDFFEASIPTGRLRLPAYERVDLAVRFRPNARWRWGLAIDNVLDETYQEAVGFEAAGMRARLSAAYTF